VLTQSREDLIKTSFESLAGAKQAIVHVYNAVSPLWRKVVFGMEPAEIKEIARAGATYLRDQAARFPQTDWHFEYSPETFSTAELDFSIACCEAVMEVLQPTVDKPIILNLPATVEAATANIYADQIDFMQWLPISPTTCLLREMAYALPDDSREMKLVRYANWRINRVVNKEDTWLIERVQQGMASNTYGAGPIGKSEVCLRSFARKIRALTPEARLHQTPPAGWSKGLRQPSSHRGES
jgi:phenylpropionate dioxygenase-like ring-hydroxylating dioxygenase large terminal subunit